MKKLNLIFLLGIIMSCILSLTSCKDESLSEKLGHEAKIMISFKVKGTSGTVFNSSIGDDNTITIKVSPYLDAVEELKSAIPTFYLSKGSTVTPDPSLPQNFAQEGGVKYTVTSEDHSTTREYIVTWGVSDKLPYGAGFSYAEVGAHKIFTELGYPGELKGYNTGKSAVEYGDLQMYHAYCGNYIVLLSRAYIDIDVNSPYCIKVVDKMTLNDAGSLNIGSISLTNIKMITSDYRGRCVAAVVTNDETEFFYWTKPSDTPISIGKINVNMAPTSDLSNNFQVAGDITTNAWITALAPRDAAGTHYRIKVTDGHLASTYSTIETGYVSSDCSQFQMISPIDDSDQPNFVIGDAEGTAGAANSVHCYVNSFAGSTLFTMPPLWQSTLQAWWVGTGFTTTRGGGRCPIVSALPINGKTYVTVTSGTSFWFAAAVLTSNLQELAHENLNIAVGDISRGWSFGEWVDWYWDEEQQEAYLSVWFGRYGLYTYKMTCLE